MIGICLRSAEKERAFRRSGTFRIHTLSSTIRNSASATESLSGSSDACIDIGASCKTRQGRMPRASGDRPVLNRRVTPVAPPFLHQQDPVLAPSLAHISGGAEEAGMKGWRERAADVFAEQGSIAAK